MNRLCLGFAAAALLTTAAQAQDAAPAASPSPSVAADAALVTKAMERLHYSDLRLSHPERTACPAGHAGFKFDATTQQGEKLHGTICVDRANPARKMMTI